MSGVLVLFEAGLDVGADGAERFGMVGVAEASGDLVVELARAQRAFGVVVVGGDPGVVEQAQDLVVFAAESLGEVPGVTVSVEPSAVSSFRWRPDRERRVGLGERLAVAGSDRRGDRFGHTVETGRGSLLGGLLGVVEDTAHRRGPGGVFEVKVRRSVRRAM